MTFVEDNVVKIIQPLYAACIKFQEKITELTDRNKDLTKRINRLQCRLEKSEDEVERLRACEVDLNRAKTVLGADIVDGAIQSAIGIEHSHEVEKQTRVSHDRNVR